ncbi:MAG: hypothetical protein ACRC2K_13295 [Clostridium sp.]
MANNQGEYTYRIPSFQSGLNTYTAEALLKPYEAISAKNCDITNGSLATIPVPTVRDTINANGKLHTISAFYDATTSTLLTGIDRELKKGATKIFDIAGKPLDYLNFEYKGKRIAVFSSKDDIPFLYDGTTCRKLKNRRPAFKEDCSADGFYDSDGKKVATEDLVTTYAPKGDYMELHYDRLWIAGDTVNPDRVYFSTAGVNGADLEDWTAPTDEAEANMHGGFIDVRSYDGGKIIGLKVIFNSVVVFKNKTAYKIFGNNPANYQLVQLFSSNGAIADKSICVGVNGAFFLNSDGIYFYDGTNTTLISQKINSLFKSMNSQYANNAVATFVDGKYYLAIPVNSTENNTLIEYDTVNKSFMVHEIGNIKRFLDYDYEMLFSDGNNILRLKDINTSSPQLPMYWKTPFTDFGAKNMRKLTNYIYFRAKGNGQLKIKCSSDVKTKELLIDLTPDEKLYRKKIKVKGRMIRLEFLNVSGNYVELTSPELLCEMDND